MRRYWVPVLALLLAVGAGGCAREVIDGQACPTSDLHRTVTNDRGDVLECTTPTDNTAGPSVWVRIGKAN
jgi:hypothetical protein